MTLLGKAGEPPVAIRCAAISDAQCVAASYESMPSNWIVSPEWIEGQQESSW